MAAEEFNSLGGYSVGIPPVPVIDANGNVVTNVLNTTGNVSAANVYAANYYYANGRPFNAGGNPYGPNNSIQYNNNGTFDGSANLTFDNTTQLLSVPSLTVSGLSNLGPVGNITITGGGSGYLLTTDGNGLIQWSPPGTGSAISNGQSNVSIDEFNGNVTIGVNSVANVVTFTSNSVLVNGNVTATNFLGNATTAGTVTTNAQPNITSVGTLTAVTVTGNVVAGGVKTNNLLYANGAPWDLQEAAGGNQQVQFNNGNNNFGASINFTYNTSTNILTVPNISANGSRLSSITGANVTGTVPFANVANNVAGANVSGEVNYANVANNVAGANVSGEVSFAAVANSIALSNVVGIGNIASINLDGNVANILHGDGTWGAESGNLNANYANYAGEAFSVSGSNVSGEVANAAYAETANTAVTVTANAQPNITSVGTLISLDVTGNVTANNFVGTLANGTSNISIPVANGNIDITAGGNKTVVVTSANVIVKGDLLPESNLTHNLGSPTQRWNDLYIAGNTIDLNGSTITSDANGITLTNPLGGTFTVVGQGASNTASIVSGNSSIVVDENSNVNISVNGITNVVVVSVDGLTVNGNANVTKNLIVGETIVATGNISGANLNTANGVYANTANITANLTSGNANLGNLATANYVNIANVLTGNIANFSGNLTSLNANLGNLAIANYIHTDEIFNGNSNVRISPNGNVTVSVTGTSNVYTLTNLGANVVGYVSANGNGTFGALYSNSLTSQGGNLTVYAATGDNYIELRPSGLGQVDVGNFRIQNLGTPNSSSDAATKQYVDDVAQGLNIHDSCQAATSNTLAIITGGVVTYNNGASGVNANLVTTGSFNLIDSVNVQTSGTRILVKNEANAAHNGIYTWANSTTIVRATDFNTVPEVEAGDFTFITGGTLYDNTGWVQTSTVVTIGTDPIEFTQFSGAGTYQAGLGLTLTGTVFSVNVDNITTEIAGGNVVVKANAQLTTPNIGAATGTSVNLTGNVLANNVNSNNKITTVDIDVSGNVIASNISANANLIVNNATVNLQLTGNTANFSGNVLIDNWLAVSNTANVGNLRTDNLLHANGVPWDLELPGGGNTQLQFNDDESFGGSANLTFNKDTSNLGVSGNVILTTGLYYGDGGGLANIAAGNVVGLNLSKIANGNSNVSIPVADGNVQINAVGNLVANITGTGANIFGTLNVTGLVTIPNTAGGATAIAMGSPTQGNLVSNAVTLTTSSSVSNAIAQLNVVLGKLVPPAPPNFPASQSITVASLSTYRMANYVQTDNTPGANKSVAGGTTVTTVRRASSYSTGNITTAGPGDTGTITSFLNGADAGNRTLTANLDGNGTYSNLVIYNNYDYNVANANIAAGFWSVFSSRTAGTVTEGWNEVYIADSATTNTNTYSWFYDSSNPGTPAFSTLTISPPGSPSYTYSSTVPHYNNTNIFTLTANVNKLSGNMYPTSDTFVTGTAGGAFGAPSSVTYATAGVTTPLAQNLYVSSGNASISTTSTIISGFGASSTGPSLSSNNSYNSNTQAFTTALAANVLYKTGTVSSASVIEEANVFVGSTIGSGSGLAFRIINPGSSDTPTYTGSEAAFNSQSSTLETYDPTVVANILKHDQTNYSTGYLPVGPNLSSGRTGAQYFTFKIVRTSVSKFDVRWTGTIAGLWVALPGSTIDSTSSANGWIDMSVAYAGAGIPGVNSPGNGSNGCALGGVAPLNSAQTNKSVTATFGTVSSSSTVTNEIYIRIKLTSGQSVTALSLQTASN